MIDPLRETVLSLVATIQSTADHRATGFLIGNTADIFDLGSFYPTPLRQTPELVYAGTIVKNVETAGKIAEIVDGRVDYIFVDAEKKIRRIYFGANDAGNIERKVRERAKKSKILTYKGNDLGVEAVDLLLGQLAVNLGNMQIAIVGSGNVGSKVALKLVERGVHVRVYRRNQERLQVITEGINEIKSEHTLSSVVVCDTLFGACVGADAIIGCANEKDIIPESMVHNMNPYGQRILIDAGKGCFSADVVNNARYTVFRIDVSTVQQLLFSALVKTHLNFLQLTGRISLEREGIRLVSLGLLGRYGEIVVDNIHTPTHIIGIADGKGSLLQDTTPLEESIQKLKDIMMSRVNKESV